MPFAYAIDSSESEIVGDSVVTTSTCGDQVFIGKMARSDFRAWLERSRRMLDEADRAQSSVRPFCGDCEKGAAVAH